MSGVEGYHASEQDRMPWSVVYFCPKNRYSGGQKPFLSEVNDPVLLCTREKS